MNKFKKKIAPKRTFLDTRERTTQQGILSSKFPKMQTYRIFNRTCCQDNQKECAKHTTKSEPALPITR